ncbi:MAG: hypothetical protein OEV99_04025 [Nitrospira sp.]|nr:hypothetical protein [Nitrospira sp.]
MPCLVVLLLLLSVNSGNALTYLDTKDKDHSKWFRNMVNDSIPFYAGERVVIVTKGVVSLWVVALLRLDYEVARTYLEEAVQKDFGVEEVHEAITNADEFKAIDMNIPKDPLFGRGFGGFRHLVPSMKSTREYAIVSKQYNRIDKVDGHSVSRWRVADGREILGKPWTIVVVERADFSREWARDHMGLLWPFKTSGSSRLVTETEISLIENSLGQRHELIDYFVPYPAYETGAVLELMNAILEKAKGQ